MKKIISLLLALAIPLYALPLAAGAAGSDEQAGFIDLKNLVDSATTGGTITLDGDAEVNADTAASPWTIGKNITIDGQGHTVIIRAPGILLNADVTFKNMQLNLTSADGRNAIIANGHSLTLDTVTAGNLSINLFGGTLIKADLDKYDVPSPGTAGIINIKGKTKLQGDKPGTLGPANIFAGNLSIGNFVDNLGEEGDGKPSTFTGNVTINIEDRSGSNALGSIYAGGGQNRKPQGASAGKEITANPDKYKVNGTVTIKGTNALPDVDGAGATAANVVYKGSGNEAAMTLKNISSLSVESGKLVPKSGSSFQENGTLSIASGTKLKLSQIELPIKNFSSNGGFLILGENQTLDISGSVTGTAKVAIGETNNNDTASTAVVQERIYIHAPNSQDGNFQLLPYSNQLDMILKRDDNGDWKASKGTSSGDENLVAAFQFDNDTASVAAGEEAEFQMTATLSNGNYTFLDHIPLAISIGQTTLKAKDEGNYYSYHDNLYEFSAYVTDNAFCITTEETGEHTFSITLPAKYAVDNKNITKTITLTVTGEATPPEPDKPTPIAVPVAKTGLKYTGEELTGVEAGTGYTLFGNTATDIGEYTATAALQDIAKYKWADGTTDAKQIEWSIGKGAAPAAPTGLKATSPTKKDGRDGQISGTTDKMEYATNSDFSNVKDCTGDTITGLPAGTYYVRVKETDKFEAGDYAVVKVLAFGEVEEVPDPPVEVKIPVSGEEKTVEVVASIKDSTAVVSAIDTTQLGSVIGDKVNTGMVRIDFSGLEQEIDTVELPGAAIGEIAAAAQAQGNDVEGLSLKLSTGSVSFDAAALASIQKQAGSKVTLKILAKDRHDLTPEQLESIGTAPAFDLSLQGNAAITDFGTGKATVSLPYTLKPGQSAAGITVYYLDEKEKALACPTRYSQVEKAATYTTSHFSLYFVGFDSAIQWKNPFNDVRKGDWFYGAVEFAELNGLMQGDSKTVFSPNQKLSRAQLAQILYNKEGKPWVRGGSSFTDVPAKEWYANAVNWAAQKGYVMGYDSTHFGPNNSITREQLATILWRYAGEPKGKKNVLSPFTDAGKASEYALPALRWAVQNEIIRGKGNNRLDPTGTATRAEVAQMLMNFLA